MYAVLGFAVAGLVIGALAHVLTPGSGLSLLANLGLGVAGALVGGVLAGLVGDGAITEPDAIAYTVYVLSALLVVGVVQARAGSTGDD